MVIDFGTDGTAQAMHFDSFPLDFLGDRSIKRASELVFNETTQKWSITVAEHLEGSTMFHEVDEATGYETYDDARRIEVAWFEASRLAGVDPRSGEGMKFLADANAEYFA